MDRTRKTHLELTDDKLIFDEKHQRFVFLRDAPHIHIYRYRYANFKTQRPDLFGFERDDFKEKQRFAQCYARHILYQNRLEIKRLWKAMGPISFPYFYPLMDDYFKRRAVDAPRLGRLWTWDDSSKMVAFVDSEVMRAEKYGLDIPTFNFAGVTQEQLKTKENELTDYFLYEMRKASRESAKAA